MLLRYYGYPQRQPSIPGYHPAVPELLPATQDGTGAIRVGKGTNLVGFIGSGLPEAARREDTSRLGGGVASPAGLGQNSCLHSSEMWCIALARPGRVCQGSGQCGAFPTWHRGFGQRDTASPAPARTGNTARGPLPAPSWWESRANGGSQSLCLLPAQSGGFGAPRFWWWCVWAKSIQAKEKTPCFGGG